MKAIKLMVCAATLMVAASVNAQDWQIGGGSFNGSENYDNDNVNYDYQPENNNKVSLFKGGHEDAPFSLSIGYVNKEWLTDFGSYTWHENLWGQEGKRLHGLQLGLGVAPCLPIGLGVRSGLYYEAYFSEAQGVKDSGYDEFTEHNLYIPLHAMYRFPFTRDISLSVFGGLGFNWAVYGEYKERGYRYYGIDGDSYYYGPHEYQQYGTGSWPKRVNFQTEIGCDLRIKNVKIGFTYSFGLTNHHLYEKYNSQQNKLGISFGIVTNGD